MLSLTRTKLHFNNIDSNLHLAYIWTAVYNTNKKHGNYIHSYICTIGLLWEIFPRFNYRVEVVHQMHLMYKGEL